MRWTSLWLCLALAAPAAAQEWPQPTEAGRKGLDALIRRCVEAGGLKESKDQKTGAATLSLADAAKVEAVLRADPAAVTPAVRDALVARWPNAGADDRAAVVCLLRQAGAAGDGRAAGFAAYFEGMAQRERDPGSALPLFREATDRFRAARDRIWQATGCNESGRVLVSLGRPREALESYQDALAIRRAALGERHPDVAQSYNNLATAYLDLGEPAKAVEYCEKALAIRRAALGERHPHVAQSYNNLADAYRHLGQPAKAVEYCEKALAIRRAALGERHPHVAGSYNSLANAYRDLGEPAKAVPLYEKALAILRAALGERHPDVASGYNNLALAYVDLGEPAKAVPLHEKALAISRAALGERHPGMASSYNNLASAYLDLGEPAKAVPLYEKALAILRAALGERHPDVAQIYNNLADAYRDLGEPAKAVPLHEKALAIYRAALGERHPLVATSYNNLATAYFDLGQPAKAVEYHEKALAIRRAALGERHPLVATSYNYLATAYFDLGQPAKAVESFDLALRALAEPTVPPGPDRGPGVTRPRALPFTAQILLWRGEVRAAVPGVDPATGVREALADFLAAADVLERLRGRDAGTGGANSERAAADKVRMGERVADLACLTVRAAARLAALERRPQRLVAAYEAAERGGARVFLEALGRSRAAAVAGVEPEALAEEQRLRAELRQADARVASEIDQPAEKVNRAVAEQRLAQRQKVEDALNAFVARLEREAPRYAAMKYPRPCSLDEARATLAEDEVALHYVLGSEGSSLLVVSPKAAPGDAGLAVYELPKRHEIAGLIAAVVETKTLDDAEGARELGAKLYRVLLAPATEAIQGKNLVIIPGGELGQLPFEVLVEPVAGEQDGRFLVEAHRIRYAPSLTALHLIRQ
jgi:tetratricopeptide (TPR) repeat protein